MARAELSEVNEIIHYLVEKSNDEALLRAYEVSYAALSNITLEDFKGRVAQKLASAGAQPTVEQVHEKVEHFIDDYVWEV